MSYVECLYSSLQLFMFPTYMGNPRQTVVSSRPEGLLYALKNDGVNGVHIRANSPGYLDKVIFEFESKDIRKTVIELEMFKDNLRKLGLIDHTLTFFSGNKSFYIYLLFKPIKVGEETAKTIVRRIYHYLLSEEYDCLDRNFLHPYHMVRLPNTFHDISRFRKVLSDCVIFTVRPRPIPTVERKLEFSELINVSADFYEEDNIRRIDHEERPKLPVDRNVLEIVKEIVRPVIWKWAQKSNPPHIVRTAFVSELVMAGFLPEEICEIIGLLNWSDYDPKITEYHVRKIWEKKLLPPSNRRLREYGIV